MSPDRRGLPPFPTDEATLDMLMAAIDPWGHGDPQAEKSSVGTFLELMSRLGGSDTEAVAEQPGENVFVMRDPQYHEHDVIVALVQEVHRLRRAARG